MSACQSFRLDEIEVLFKKLDSFKEIGSHPFYIEDATKCIKTWEEDVRKMFGFSHQQDVLDKLSGTIRQNTV